MFAVLIWYSAMVKLSMSHVCWLKLGSKLFLAMSQIYGSARLTVARLGLRTIFSCATVTLSAMSKNIYLKTDGRHTC